MTIPPTRGKFALWEAIQDLLLLLGGFLRSSPLLLDCSRLMVRIGS